MHACSCSKAIAAFAEEAFREEILCSSLKAYTEHTKTSADDLRSEFAKIVDQGYAECDQEIDIGTSSVAAPVQIGHIGASFSVGAVGPIRRFNAGYRQHLGHDLKQLSAKISAAIQLCNVADIETTDLPLLKPGKEGTTSKRQH
jgi:DNA-binding IclR family transcriptional regulator